MGSVGLTGQEQDEVAALRKEKTGDNWKEWVRLSGQNLNKTQYKQFEKHCSRFYHAVIQWIIIISIIVVSPKGLASDMETLKAWRWEMKYCSDVYVSTIWKLPTWSILPSYMNLLCFIGSKCIYFPISWDWSGAGEWENDIPFCLRKHTLFNI